jgi:TonB-linked SusC/RagA family outer membrane protein
MKVTTFLLFVTVFKLFAVNASGQNEEISLEMRNKTVKEVLAEIEKKTECHFFYNSALIDVNRVISIDVKNERVDALLKEIFSNTTVTYRWIDKHVVLTVKEINKVIEGKETGSLHKLKLEVNSLKNARTIKGKVTDNLGEPLPGVTIQVKGTQEGTITDYKGNYTIKKVPLGATLVFSFIGMRSQELVVDGQTTIDVKMLDDVVGLDEVISVGYASQKKINSTGAVASIQYEKKETLPVTNAVTALVGQVPGVTILQNSNKPGTNTVSIDMRGMGSINASTNPLVVIDGVTSSMAVFSQLNPSEIQSVNILKDAASAAIYGSRAANGVIIINTKEAKEGPVKVNFNAYWGVQNATVFPDLMDAVNYIDLVNEGRLNNGDDVFISEDIKKLVQEGDPDGVYGEVDWMDILYRPAPIQNYNASITGGNKNVKTNTSVSYFDQTGMLINTGTNRLNVRNRSVYKLSKNFKIDFNIFFSEQNTHESAENIYKNTKLIPYIIPYYTPGVDVDVIPSDENSNIRGFNNELRKQSASYNNSKVQRYGMSLAMDYSWKKWHSNVIFSRNGRNNKDKLFIPYFKVVDEDGDIVNHNEMATLEQVSVQSTTDQVDGYIDYSTKLGKHHLKGLLGSSYLKTSNTSFLAEGRNFPNNNIQVLDAANMDFHKVAGREGEQLLICYFGRLNYNYKEKYLFEANARYDGSSKFSKDNQYSFFPSFSAAWRISQENFLSSNTVLDNLKLRLSWGQLGNQYINSLYASTSVYDLNAGYLFDGILENGIAINEMSNPHLTWEVTETTNIGLDITAFGKFNLTADAFKKDVKDLFIRVPIPSTSGDLTPPYQNIGKMSNKGIELSMSYSDNLGSLLYSFNMNASYIKNELEDLGGYRFDNGEQWMIEGHPLASWFGYEFDGIFQSEEEIAQAPFHNSEVKPGDIRYKDSSGPNGKPDGIIDVHDKGVIGNAFPEWTFGFGATASYKSFDFNIFFNGVAGNEIAMIQPFNNLEKLNSAFTADWINRWTPDNPGTEYPRLGGYGMNSEMSDFWLEDGSYLRLQNLEIGYNIPGKTIKKWGFSKFRIYVGGSNLLTFTKVKNVDPSRYKGSTANFVYPMAKIYQVGVNVNF